MKFYSRFFLVWGVCGFIYFVLDTLVNEERWTRELADGDVYFWGGPVVWILYVILYIVAKIASFFG